MGSLLEMMLRNGMLLCLVAVLASGCDLRIGTGAQKDLGFGNIVDNIQAARGRNAPAPQGAQNITRASIDKIDKTLIRVGFTRYNIQDVFTQVATREGVSTYLSPKDQTITLQNGVLRMTRGLPYDLLESDIRSQSKRTYRYLTATNTISELTVSCSRQKAGSETIEIVERSYSTTIVSERCSGQGFNFENRYWTSGATTWKSLQWIGPTHGFALIEKLN